ncbi:leucine-rich_repeat domain-containing protein [Hexamita inflata]|uniref:Leucine-rich repeat domain-containing protein n=1 Tax=Hexamita inflata TaxID=28002 RepID=A0AA86R102_9EUKA|nr:leucine-rich repeat domain-containing protein [Hexamita inflata]
MIPTLLSRYIKEITLIECKITSIEELMLPNLEVLTLQDQYVIKLASIQGIQKFQKLKKVSLSGYYCIDLSSIELVVQLQKLNLQNCQNIISNITSSSIKELVIIECILLNLDNVNVENVEVLTILEQEQFQHKFDISRINRFKQLKQLQLNGYSIDLNLLKDLKQLKILVIKECGVFNLPALGSLMNLQKLNLTYDIQKDINPILYLEQLNELEANVKYFWDEYLLHMLSNLKQTVISFTQFQIEYDQKVSWKYANQIKNGVLTINKDEQLIEQLFQQVCGRRLIELRGLFYVINFVETKQCQACQYFHFANNQQNSRKRLQPFNRQITIFVFNIYQNILFVFQITLFIFYKCVCTLLCHFIHQYAFYNTLDTNDILCTNTHICYYIICSRHITHLLLYIHDSVFSSDSIPSKFVSISSSGQSNNNLI